MISIVGVDPMKVNSLQHAAESTGGENRIENIEVVGNRTIDQVMKVFPMAKGLLGRMYPGPGMTLAADAFEYKPTVSGDLSQSRV
jgi:hypothetical protein